MSGRLTLNKLNKEMKVEVRIIEPELRVSDLQNTDSIGFITEGGIKGHLIYCREGYCGISVGNHEHDNQCNLSLSSRMADTIVEAFEFIRPLSSLYRFDTRKELYKWLSED